MTTDCNAPDWSCHISAMTHTGDFIARQYRATLSRNFIAHVSWHLRCPRAWKIHPLPAMRLFVEILIWPLVSVPVPQCADARLKLKGLEVYSCVYCCHVYCFDDCSIMHWSSCWVVLYIGRSRADHSLSREDNYTSSDLSYVSVLVCLSFAFFRSLYILILSLALCDMLASIDLHRSIYNANGSRGDKVFTAVCLCVCFSHFFGHNISKTDAAISPNLTQKCSMIRPGNSFILRSKGQMLRSRVIKTFVYII